MDIGKAIINTANEVADAKAKKLKYTKSSIGRIVSISGYEIQVEMGRDIVSARLLEHLLGTLNVGDMVWMQDLHNSNYQRFVVGKVG